jgi:hypothetical protein
MPKKIRETAVRKAVRQGDVLMVPIPPGRISGQPVEAIDGRYILAEGELSGHYHMVKAQPGMAMISDGVDAFLTIPDTASSTLDHHKKRANGAWTQADHDSLKLATGEHEVIIQRRVLPGSEHYVVPSED